MPCSSLVKGRRGSISAAGRVVAQHVQSHSLLDTLVRSDPIDALLHFVVSTVAPLHGIGCGGQQRIIQKGQRLVQVGREYFLEGLADLFETANTPAELRQFFQGGIGTAAPVEQPVYFVHDLAQRARMGKASRDTHQRFLLSRGQVMLDKKIPALEEVRDLFLHALFPTRRLLLRGRGGPAPPELRHGGLQYPCALWPPPSERPS